mmetsp:Transcript_12511/g.41754  ORF Transcript_12511/g.41754 Transcript_12511/m.41754 type:complete len:327 (-) Transcript_12511:104-1084(-)
MRGVSTILSLVSLRSGRSASPRPSSKRQQYETSRSVNVFFTRFKAPKRLETVTETQREMSRSFSGGAASDASAKSCSAASSTAAERPERRSSTRWHAESPSAPRSSAPRTLTQPAKSNDRSSSCPVRRRPRSPAASTCLQPARRRPWSMPPHPERRTRSASLEKASQRRRSSAVRARYLVAASAISLSPALFTPVPRTETSCSLRMPARTARTPASATRVSDKSNFSTCRKCRRRCSHAASSTRAQCERSRWVHHSKWTRCERPPLVIRSHARSVRTVMPSALLSAATLAHSVATSARSASSRRQSARSSVPPLSRHVARVRSRST